MGKTLVIAEKPSVARDLAAALPGSYKQAKEKTHLVGDDYVITWAVGHLVGLAEPDAYDPKLKKWRFADLPIIPEEFKLVPNDERAAKQLRAIHRLMADPEVDQIVNACDAGREGELIFAYVYDTAKAKKPVQRLWLSSMTKKAIGEAFGHLRDGNEMKPLEAAARSRSEADWVVGMNATRAASIRLRAAFDGAVSLGPRADAHARARGPPRGGDPRLQAGALLAGGGPLRSAEEPRATRAATWAANGSRPRLTPRRSWRPARIARARSPSSRRRRSASARSCSTT